MFADDTTLWTCSKNPEFAQKIIQRKLRSVERWANSWRVKPNPLKSQCILMSYPGQKQPQRQFDNLHINNLPIPKLKTIRYLGVAFSHNCSLHPDVQQTLKKTRNRANLLYHIRGRIHGCHPKTLNHTYKTYDPSSTTERPSTLPSPKKPSTKSQLAKEE
ncbi:unnamed protein product [Tenebrio molitor]|jgi:hypothetical protein|nr:unnamed protein product [Tenebrio molitor]